jgi:hypothetical protein
MTPYAEKLLFRVAIREKRIKGWWMGIHTKQRVEVISDNDRGKLLVQWPDGHVTEQSRAWFLELFAPLDRVKGGMLSAAKHTQKLTADVNLTQEHPRALIRLST